MRRRTSVILDSDLLAEAESILGTTRATEAIRLALTEVINLEKRRRLVALDLPDLTPESLEQSRREWLLDSDDDNDARPS